MSRRVDRLTPEQQSLAAANRGLAYRLAQPYMARSADPDHYESAALLGLCEAAARFDPDRGVKFSGFAWRVIANELKIAAREDAVSRRVCARTARPKSSAKSPAVGRFAAHREFDVPAPAPSDQTRREFARLFAERLLALTPDHRTLPVPA